VYHISWVAILLFRARIYRKNPKKEGQDIYPGNDDNEDAPIGYFVIKDDLADMSVISQ